MHMLFKFSIIILCGFASAQLGNTLNNLNGNFNNLLNSVSNAKTFAEFKIATGRTYATPAEEKLRERLFLSKKAIVDKHVDAFNSGRVNFEVAINEFSDRKLEEFLKGLTGRIRTTIGDGVIPLYKTNQSISSNEVPDSFDWRDYGGVTPVKFQGLECGACWSFAVTGAIEGHIFRKTGQLISLSEQNLVDCAYNFGNEGCDGGFQEYGFAYVLENGGIAAESPYPYAGQQQECMYQQSKKAAEIQGYSTIPEGNEEAMKRVIATLGPIACSVNAGPDSFQLYKSGIYMDNACNEAEVNHAVLVVGYGTENGQDYWIIKNSWTEKWGEGGYMRLPRNKMNYCGIASECSYPIV